jgi:hypothetical protein
VTRLPGDDKDPCDFLLAHGREAFEAALKESSELFDYKFEMVQKKHDLLQPMGVKNAADELMGLISSIPDPILKNRYRYEVLKRLNIDERDLRYETRAAQPANVPAEGNSDTGMVPEPESDLAKLERELLNFLFHEPAWMGAAIGQMDLATLTGKPEAVLGRAILEAMQDGALPPDAEALATSQGAAGSVVARELLRRIPDDPTPDVSPSENGKTGSGPANNTTMDAARSLCIALAEGLPQGVKLDAESRLQMVLRSIRKSALYRKHDEANRRLAHARLNGDTQQVDAAYQQVVQLRKAIAELKLPVAKGLQPSMGA